MEHHIRLHLFASLTRFLPDSGASLPIKSGASISEVIHRLGIPGDMVKLIFINGVKAGPDARLDGGERVGLFPPIGGG